MLFFRNCAPAIFLVNFIFIFRCSQKVAFQFLFLKIICLFFKNIFFSEWVKSGIFLVQFTFYFQMLPKGGISVFKFKNNLLFFQNIYFCRILMRDVRKFFNTIYFYFQMLQVAFWFFNLKIILLLFKNIVIKITSQGSRNNKYTHVLKLQLFHI